MCSREERKVITTSDFVRMLLEHAGGGEASLSFAYGLDKGWLQPQDEVEQGEPLRRKNLARILHDFLRMERREKDEDNWGEAARLGDLYDCHTCVNHVAQMYVKGIVPPVQITLHGQKTEIFGMGQLVTPAEACHFLAAALDKALRHIPGDIPEDNPGGRAPGRKMRREPEYVPEEKMELFFREHPGAVCVDVRASHLYKDWHLPYAVNLPMAQILKSPEGIEKKDAVLFLYCNLGYQSGLVANCLAENGYTRVYYGKCKAKGGKNDTQG